MNFRVQLEVDLAAIVANYRKIVSYAAPCVVLPVIKYNAYNLGSVKVAEVLHEAGAPWFFVATLDEALELRRHGFAVQIAGSLLPFEVAEAVSAGVICPVNSLECGRQLSLEAIRQQKSVDINFQLDTGMGRDGISLNEAAKIIDAVCELPGLHCRGIYSHFPGALPQFSEFTRRQIADLGNFSQDWECIHFGGGDGMANYRETTRPPFTHCRVGLALYGLGSAVEPLQLQPVLTLKSALALVRELPAGSNVGYNFTHSLKRKTRVGTVAIGYADGLPLALSNCGEVIVRGRRCPIIGRVSMDYINIDLNHVPQAVPGDEVICLNSEITVNDWVKHKQTHPHEILCALGNRMKRSYHY